MSANGSPTVTVEEAAALLHISRTVAYGWLQGAKPLLPHQRRGSRYILFRADVERLAANGLAATTGHARDYSAPNGHATEFDLGRVLADLLAGRDVEFRLETPIGEIGGVVHLAPSAGQARR